MMLHEALNYLGRASIIPLNGKIPAIPSWKEYQTRKPTTEEVTEWWTKNPNYNIGIVTGKISNITVVDIDTGEIPKEFPQTPTVKTGKGYHLYYQYEEGVNNSARILENIDIRGEGGYVVAPPSVHPDTGKKYEWTVKSQIQPFPSHLFGVRKQKTDWTKIAQGSEVGQRNETAAKYMGKLMSIFDQDTWENTVWETALIWNQKNNPPLPETELRITFESIRRKALENPNFLEVEEKVKTQLEQRKPEEGISLDRKEKRYTWGTPNLDNNIVILKRGNLAIIGAKRNMGKTTFTFDMACKNAKLGHKVLYLSLEMEKGQILETLARNYAGITVEEEYNYDIPEHKMKKMRARLEELSGIENLVFEGIRRGDSVIFETLKTLMDQHEPDLVFIDNLDLIAGEKAEEENQRQKRIVTKLMSYTSEKNIPIILIHHYRKGNKGTSGMDELAGSGKIADGADIVINLSRKTIEEIKNEGIQFPESKKTILWVQKGRGYSDYCTEIFYVGGTFYDYARIPEDLKHQEEIKNLYTHKDE